MSESPKRPAPPKDAAPAGEAAQKNAIHKLRATLETSLADGNLTRARAHLRMTSPVTARAAVMALGAPYVKALQAAPHVTLDGKQGAAAAKQFIDEELRPLVTREARKAASPRKDFNAQKNKSVPPKNSLLKRLWRGTAMTALVLGLSTSMVIETAAPARSDIHADTAVVTESIRTDVSALRTEFGKTSLGRDMLALADRHNITIVYDDALSGTNTLGSYNAGSKTLRMNPSQTLAEQVMIMSHELRHAWQDVVLGYGEMENRLLTPQQQWTLRRYLESDAFAFSAYFMAERMLELPEAEKPDGLREMAAAHLLHGEFASEDGLTHEEYRRFALDRMFETLGSSYNETHLRLANEQNKPLEDDPKFAQQLLERGDLDGALVTMRALQARMRTTPSAEDFDAYLRRFGGMSLDPAEQTALQSPAAANPAGRTAAAPTAAQTPAPQDPDAPSPTSSDSAVNAQLAASEALNQTFRALAREMTRYVELERQMAIRAGRPTTNSRFIPVVPAGGDTRAQEDAPAQNRTQPRAP
ncbi:MAG: hypothetical protein H3C49_08800 [Alphaproteobacteria bacterium]|nr:hypothetical protein [Alphaproteobacteria bacterium]